MKLGIAGDIAFSGLISTDRSMNDERFAWLAGELGKCDGLLANLEAPVVADERNRGKRAYLFADPDVMSSLLAKLKVVCVSLANNHILDCGREGLANTLGLLDKNGIFHCHLTLLLPLFGEKIARGVTRAFFLYHFN